LTTHKPLETQDQTAAMWLLAPPQTGISAVVVG